MNYDKITNQIIETMERDGLAPWHKSWTVNGGGLPVNHVSGKAYRGLNVFLLASAPYGSNEWLTFKQAKAKKGSVRKGEKGTTVFFWKWLEKIEKDEKTGEDKKITIPMIRTYTVFNIEQCDDINPRFQSDSDEKTTFETLEECSKVVEGFDGPKVSHGGNRAFYAPSKDAVVMPKPETFTSSEEYYGVLFHELCHSTGHETRLKREGIMGLSPFGSPSYSQEELVAEMGAAFLCAHCGTLPATIENSAAYLKGWLKALKDDKKMLIYAGAQAQKASDLILGFDFDEHP